MTEHNCSCNSTVRKNWGTVKLPSGKIVCDFCQQPTEDQVHNPVTSKTTEDFLKEESLRQEERLVKRKQSQEAKYTVGSIKEQAEKAAREADNNALLFRNYGVVIQWVGGILAALIFIGYTFAFPSGYKLLALLIAGLIFAPFWFAGALLRGAASYVRFKALAYLADKNK
jgi:Flp pilus assembly protein TadB